MGMVLFFMRKKKILFLNEYEERFKFVPKKVSVDPHFSRGTNFAVDCCVEAKTLEQLNRMMLIVDPEKRPTASKCLQIIRKLRQQKSSFD